MLWINQRDLGVSHDLRDYHFTRLSMKYQSALRDTVLRVFTIGTMVDTIEALSLSGGLYALDVSHIPPDRQADRRWIPLRGSIVRWAYQSHNNATSDFEYGIYDSHAIFNGTDWLSAATWAAEQAQQYEISMIMKLIDALCNNSVINELDLRVILLDGIGITESLIERVSAYSNTPLALISYVSRPHSSGLVQQCLKWFENQRTITNQHSEFIDWLSSLDDHYLVWYALRSHEYIILPSRHLRATNRYIKTIRECGAYQVAYNSFFHEGAVRANHLEKMVDALLQQQIHRGLGYPYALDCAHTISTISPAFVQLRQQQYAWQGYTHPSTKGILKRTVKF